MIDDELLQILACPATHQPLRVATADELARVNEGIRAGTCKNVDGAAVAGELVEGLVREDATVLYAVRDEIPVLLVEEGILLTS